MKKANLLNVLFAFICTLNSLGAISETLKTDVLVVGGSQSGTMAAIQAARQGSKVVLVSSGEWLGGSMTEAGVSAIDGNEILAFQTGLWGEFLVRLARAEPNLLQYGWVSFFTFNPKIGNEILKNWIKEEKNITWLKNKTPKRVTFNNSGKYRKVTGIELNNSDSIEAKVTIDASEFGDLLSLGNILYRLGWEYSDEFKEPSAPRKSSPLIERYPLQELTWVFYIKDYGSGNKAPIIAKPPGYSIDKAKKRFWCSYKNEDLIEDSRKFSHNLFNPNWSVEYRLKGKHEKFASKESFLTYGQISPTLFMINWPQCGNDYSKKIERLFSDDESLKTQFLEEAQNYSWWFARYMQDTLGQRFGLAKTVFPKNTQNRIAGLAYIPYNREVRRLEGLETMTENDILPNLEEGEYAKYHKDSIAIGNYANDHHYFEMANPKSRKYFKLAPKSFQWGGRYTGTPFSIPYRVLLPVKVDGLIVAEKSWSVSHIANGSTRLQPVCMLIGQAAGSAAALAAQKGITPFELSVKELQVNLLNDETAPPTLVPLFDLKPDNPYRGSIQKLMLNNIIPFPKDGQFHPNKKIESDELASWAAKAKLSNVWLENVLSQETDLTKSKAAFLIDSKMNPDVAKDYVIKDFTGQKIADYPTKEYCGTLKAVGNKKSFQLEWTKTKQDNKPIMRKTPFKENRANLSGAITFDPEVYEFMLENTKHKSKICFKGVYNHSGSWMLITEILESSSTD
ncbi:MAG: FAD-dependent oxidoreductase [Candidatus Caenarcaniphilales bacterium]|nr:FAD-dependent oxidoreductase [Candidatus Caenarcaniphilales bacterium]